MHFARSLLERSTRNWTFKRRLGEEFGHSPLFVSPSGGLKYLLKSMKDVDPILLSFCKDHVSKGAVVWDVGANVGLFSVAASAVAGKTGKVFSFEPDPWLIQLLRKSAKCQQAENAPIEVIPGGIAQDVAIRTFALANRSRSTNYLAEYGTTQTGGVRQNISIICLSLDWLAERLPLPQVLKIDVEGAEKEVFLGATKFFDSCRPTVHVEVSAKSVEFVADFFLGRSYQCFDADSGLAYEPANINTIANILALPR